ncbi:uncharacterized protein Z520_04996 [Fonsecaea multimorphosa CBS 102226]|uniref:Enoyl-CoA hydratase n=1 Tax=Fonsecaea multimorphosa CBS 102226 TaxID=1442371 RepID=A0A0D2HC42_9EURO|nr:uncharacterized protein Z520_04996 [Fonsecaea multimorphosa CBS 102226]KIX99420.1 hypothetical protein Z520_04996 [Fonsecaea multimorphosa CBS 102226]OAL25748.1 hypothetical protein AYO22_04737 [Fonsecaea multimorphosa]
MANATTTSPPPSPSFIISYPAPFVLLVTINRERAMNSVDTTAHWQAESIFDWYDQEPSLRVAIITGAGTKSFCAGADLIEQGKLNMPDQGGPGAPHKAVQRYPPGGFAGISLATHRKKPIIAAVNGYALGGGFEIVLNCDMVVASPTAVFGLPEAARGLAANAGGLPRLMRLCGLQVASEIALTGRKLSAEEALRLNLVNKISQTQHSLVQEAVELAERVASFSPDAIIVSRFAIREAWQQVSVEQANRVAQDRFARALYKGENAQIGLDAFAQKKEPRWRPSNL